MSTPAKKWKMSASSIGAFKDCPTRFRLGWVEGLRKIEDTEAQRMGTNWHKCLEVTRAVVGAPCPVCFGRNLGTLAREDCPVCRGQGTVLEGDPQDRAIAYLNDCYATIPDWADKTAWAVERVILAYSLVGYLWYWAEADAETETLATEVPFDLPLRNPATGRALPHVTKVGVIDRLIRYRGQVLVNEYKSTSKGIDSDSTYWNRLMLDTQIGLYVLAAVELWDLDHAVTRGIESGDECPSGVLYDVWHRPATKPKKLTQAETKAFMASGGYMGQTFKVEIDNRGLPEGLDLLVDGEKAEVIPGAEKKPTKKDPNPECPFAIRETPEMFGTRLLADIQENPEKHFARRTIARTAADLDKVERELYSIYKSIRTMDKLGHWFTNEKQCEATFHCQYCPICYHQLDVFDGVTPVDGFKRIFQQETTNGETTAPDDDQETAHPEDADATESPEA